MKALRRDERGSAVVLAPVFIILGVVILATILTGLYTQNSVAQRSVLLDRDAATVRSVTAVLEAELQTYGPDAVGQEMALAGPGYQPQAWVDAPAAGSGASAETSLEASVRYKALAFSNGHIIITVTIGSTTGADPRDTMLEFEQTEDGAWRTVGFRTLPIEEDA